MLAHLRGDLPVGELVSSLDIHTAGGGLFMGKALHQLTFGFAGAKDEQGRRCMHDCDDFIVEGLELLLELAVLHVIRLHALCFKGLRGQSALRAALMPLRLRENDGSFVAEFGGKNDHGAAVVDPESDVGVHGW